LLLLAALHVAASAFDSALLLLLALLFLAACRTWVSGVTAENLQGAPELAEVQKAAADLLLLLLLLLCQALHFCCLQDMGQRRHS
jgi:hypothetical protein